MQGFEWLLNKLSAWLEKRGGTRMITRTEYRANSHFPEELPYLKRHYLLHTPWFTVFLHQFFRSDRDDPHDHPWDSISIPLFPGFFELTFGDNWHTYSAYPGVTKWRMPFGVYFRRAHDAHIIKVKEGYEGRTWSLFIHFKREREWGFWRYSKDVPMAVIKPGCVYHTTDQAIVHMARRMGLEVIESDYETDIINRRATTVTISYASNQWEWMDFKCYGREVIGGHNIKSSSVPEGEPDFKVKGWILPRVIFRS